MTPYWYPDIYPDNFYYAINGYPDSKLSVLIIPSADVCDCLHVYCTGISPANKVSLAISQSRLVLISPPAGKSVTSSV